VMSDAVSFAGECVGLSVGDTHKRVFPLRFDIRDSKEIRSLGGQEMNFEFVVFVDRYDTFGRYDTCDEELIGVLGVMTCQVL
jgi:hypothetical protein